jgi:uncharacterized NAD(P)/FAD-binding protein YdhS
MHLVVVGGGAAGSLLALLVLRHAPAARVTLVDRRAAFGRGVAYGAGESYHRINVPAIKMGGIDVADEGGFVRWLAAHGREPGSFAESFVPRSWFGDYLACALQSAGTGGRLQLLSREVTRLKPTPDGRWRCLGPELALLADQVALCPGNPAPARPTALDLEPRVVADVWAPHALDGIEADETVLLLGSGATAIDAVLALVARGHRGHLTMLSRRGLLPLVDVPPQPYPDFFNPADATGLRAVMRRLREEVAHAAGTGVPWQVVLDAFRVHAAAVWQRLGETDRRRFLRHARALWMVHRHRLAPDIASRLDEMRAAGALTVVAGRLQEVRSTSADGIVSYRPRGCPSAQQLRVHRILNCIGPSEDLAALDEPLWTDLFAAGTVRAGPLGIGLDVDPQLRLIDSQGRIHRNLYALGLPTRGRFWEVTAVTHIRRQAEALAARLAG